MAFRPFSLTYVACSPFEYTESCAQAVWMSRHQSGTSSTKDGVSHAITPAKGVVSTPYADRVYNGQSKRGPFLVPSESTLTPFLQGMSNIAIWTWMYRVSSVKAKCTCPSEGVYEERHEQQCCICSYSTRQRKRTREIYRLHWEES